MSQDQLTQREATVVWRTATLDRAAALDGGHRDQGQLQDILPVSIRERASVACPQSFMIWASGHSEGRAARQRRFACLRTSEAVGFVSVAQEAAPSNIARRLKAQPNIGNHIIRSDVAGDGSQPQTTTW
ncbi:hypothetical protein TPAR_00899, partial [Tolypocladium paradoxum]